MRDDAVRTGRLWGPISRAALVLAAGLSMSGCAGMGEAELPSLLSSISSKPEADPAGTQEQAPAGELEKATGYWGQEFAKKPTDLQTALSYARNLKALGQKQKAVEVLQQAALFHGTDRELNSEYGRLALEFDQVSLAQQLLSAADDPAKPDWKVISARGTVMAKQGQYKDAIPFYERALQLSPGQPSVLNNLALAYTMNGEAARAEGLLRQVEGNGAASAKVRQNLALVLGLQGKYDEATKVGSEVAPAVQASSNTAVIKQMVKLAPQSMPAPIAGTWEPVVKSAPGAGQVAKSTTEAQIWQTSVSTQKSAAATPPAPVAAVASAAPAQAAPAAAVAQGSPSQLRPSAN